MNHIVDDHDIRNIVSFENIFITVGTTEFDDLIESIDNEEFLRMLHQLHCKNLTIQIGRGSYPKQLQQLCPHYSITVNIYRYKPDLKDDMMNANIIISHCGAGSILETLSIRKPLIVVVNSTLQGNHQTELSDELSKNNHCLSTDPKDLINTLSDIYSRRITLESFTIPFPEANLDTFPNILDELFGFENN